MIPFPTRTWWASLLILLFALIGPTAQADPQFPPLSGRIVDAANIIPADRKASIEAKLAALEQTTRQQLVVATIPDLQGYDIADYGYRLGRAWGIGTKERNDGVLLIVAPNERRTRIEVGYGLEPVLTDAYSSVIINSVMIPQFRQGDYGAGIEAGVDAIVQQIQLPPEQARARAAEAEAAQRKGSGGGWQGTLIFWGIIFFFVILPLLRGFGGRRYRGRSGLGEVILWTALNAAANSRNDGGWGGGGGGGWGGGGGGGFSGGGGSFGGGGASGGW